MLKTTPPNGFFLLTSPSVDVYYAIPITAANDPAFNEEGGPNSLPPGTLILVEDQWVSFYPSEK